MQKILILDFGSQTTHLIGRRLRNLGAGIKISDPETPLEEIKKLNPAGVILSGGPSSVYGKGSPTVDKHLFNLKIPILGICYGWQLIAYLLGGKVEPGQKEYGPQQLKIKAKSTLLTGIPGKSTVWVSHGDTVTKLPPSFVPLASTEKVAFAAAFNPQKKIYGVQFHPEVSHTQFGKQILINFLSNLCSLVLKQKKITSLMVEGIIHNIRGKIGDKKAICAISGGVDSTIAAYLTVKAVGKNLIPVHIDNGLMRQETTKEIREIFSPLGIKPVIVKAQNLFLKKLKNITDYRKKRKIIGNLYIKLFEEKARKIKDVKFLVQGTLYSDFIESQGTKYSSNIRFHHNVSGLPKKMSLTLVEPLKEFYKDEVRQIGKILKMPDNLLYKQPFPGPGQAIRIIGKLTVRRLKMQQQADQILLEEIKKAGFYRKVFQSFTVLTGAKSTGVRGDGKFLGEVIALRIYDSEDIMTAGWSKLPYSLIQKVSSRIVNEVDGVSRVVYDITTKPPATMEWE